MSDRAGHRDLWTINADVASLHQGTNDPAIDRFPDWGAQGNLSRRMREGVPVDSSHPPYCGIAPLSVALLIALGISQMLVKPGDDLPQSAQAMMRLSCSR